MKLFSVVCFALICAVTLALDINDVRKKAIAQVDAQVGSIQKLADETSVEVEKREPNIKIITKHVREYGDGIFSNTMFQINRNAKSAYMLANLLGSSNEVFRCIEYRERDAVTDAEKVYSQQFLNPGRDYETKAEQYQRDLIKAWKDDYYKAIRQYGDYYKRAVSDINKSTSESQINSIVKQFESITKQMADIIISIHPNMAKAHIQILKNLNQLVVKFQQYSRYRIDETAKNIDLCFPKSYKPIFDFDSLFVY